MNLRRICALALCALLALSSLTGCIPTKTETSSVPETSYTPENSLTEASSSEESSSEESNSAAESSSQSSAETADSSAVSSAEDVVAVTIPADFFQNVIKLDDLVTTARQLGMENYRTNSDGSVTFYMTEAMRQTVVQTFSSTLKTYAESLSENAAWPAVIDCELNDGFTAVTLYVDEDAYAEQDRAAARALYVPVSLYRLFLGEDTASITLQITVKNEDGSKTLETFTLPE